MTTSLWLELKFDHQTRVFELRPDDERVIVVGSLLRADVRVDRVGVKPVHFQFERAGDELLLKPAYGSDLRVCGDPPSERHVLRGQSFLEFAGARMVVRVIEKLWELGSDVPSADGSFAATEWGQPNAVTVVAPPPGQTPDPMISITRPDDDECETTEIIPAPPNRKLHPAVSTDVALPQPPPQSLPLARDRNVRRRHVRTATAILIALLLLLVVVGLARR